MEALRQLEVCFLCGIPIFEASQPGILLCKHGIACQNCQKQANWSIRCTSCQQVWGHQAPDPNIAQWQANIQLVLSWGVNEYTDAYLQQQVQWYSDWRQQKVPFIPVLTVQPGTVDSTPQQSALPDLSQLPVRPLGQGLIEVWKCGYCGQGGNEGNRCIHCNRVNFQAVPCEQLPDDILALFEPVKDLSQQEVRRLGEVKSGPWECGYCGVRGNMAQRCSNCDRVNFQTVPCDPLSEEILALFEVSDPTPTFSQVPPILSSSQKIFRGPLPERIPLPDPPPDQQREEAKAPLVDVEDDCTASSAELLDIRVLQVRRVGEDLSQPWHCCCCGQSGNTGQNCGSCNRVNFLQVPRSFVPQVVLAALEPAPIYILPPVSIQPKVVQPPSLPGVVKPPPIAAVQPSIPSAKKGSSNSALESKPVVLQRPPQARIEEEKERVPGKVPLLSKAREEERLEQDAIDKANSLCKNCALL